ncbi:MAG: hypothetical protein SX243_21650 [Acidobacteriota bacterium]|nr:hypothetical protein [Acidobacteriota bacterium]
MPETNTYQPSEDLLPADPSLVYVETGTDSQANEDAGTSAAAFRIFLSVSGLGSFKAGFLDTGKGDLAGFVPAGKVVPLRATAGPGHVFSHWTLNGQFAGTNPVHRVVPKPGLKIGAVFQREQSELQAEGQREVLDPWTLTKGVKDEEPWRPTPDTTEVKVKNSSGSPFSVDLFVNGSQLVNLGKGTSHTMSCSPSDDIRVKTNAGGQNGQKAEGTFVYNPRS